MKNSQKFKQTEVGEIPKNWSIFQIGKLGKVVTGKTPPTADRDNYGGDTPFICIPDIARNVHITKTNKTLSTKGVLKVKSCILPKDSIVVSCIATIGLVGLTHKPSVTNQQINSIIPNNEVLPRFLYYRLQNFEKLLSSYGGGGSVFNIVSKSKFENIPLAIPPKVEQQQIASILSSLDDKIELNRKMNKTLEEIGKALFKRWFVDFEFPNENGEPYKSSGGAMVESELGVIPKGWSVKKINDLDLEVTDFVANGSFASLKQNTSILDNPDYALFLRNTDLKDDFSSGFKYVDEHSYNFLAKTKLYGGEVIISNVGDVGSVYRCPYFNKPMTLGNNQIVIKAGENNLFFYLLFISHIGRGLINSITSGSVQLKFNKTDFRNLQLVWPSKEVLITFLHASNEIYSYIDENKKQIKALIQTRDSLLPRLMSGKIRV